MILTFIYIYIYWPTKGIILLDVFFKPRIQLSGYRSLSKRRRSLLIFVPEHGPSEKTCFVWSYRSYMSHNSISQGWSIGLYLTVILHDPTWSYLVHRRFFVPPPLWKTRFLQRCSPTSVLLVFYRYLMYPGYLQILNKYPGKCLFHQLYFTNKYPGKCLFPGDPTYPGSPVVPPGSLADTDTSGNNKSWSACWAKWNRRKRGLMAKGWAIWCFLSHGGPPPKLWVANSG